jgi:hypothetical protein
MIGDDHSERVRSGRVEVWFMIEKWKNVGGVHST